MIFTHPVTLVPSEFLRVHRVALHAFHCLHRVALMSVNCNSSVTLVHLDFAVFAVWTDAILIFLYSRPASQHFRPSVLLLCLLLERLLISSLIFLPHGSPPLFLPFTMESLVTCPFEFRRHLHFPLRPVHHHFTLWTSSGADVVPLSSLSLFGLFGSMRYQPPWRSHGCFRCRPSWAASAPTSVEHVFDRADILHKSGIFTPPLSSRSILLHPVRNRQRHLMHKCLSCRFRALELHWEHLSLRPPAAVCVTFIPFLHSVQPRHALHACPRPLNWCILPDGCTVPCWASCTSPSSSSRPQHLQGYPRSSCLSFRVSPSATPWVRHCFFSRNYVPHRMFEKEKNSRWRTPLRVVETIARIAPLTRAIPDHYKLTKYSSETSHVTPEKIRVEPRPHWHVGVVAKWLVRKSYGHAHATFPQNFTLLPRTPSSLWVVQVLPSLRGRACDRYASTEITCKVHPDASCVLQHIHEHTHFRCEGTHVRWCVLVAALLNNTACTLGRGGQSQHSEQQCPHIGAAKIVSEETTLTRTEGAQRPEYSTVGTRLRRHVHDLHGAGCSIDGSTAIIEELPLRSPSIRPGSLHPDSAVAHWMEVLRVLHHVWRHRQVRASKNMKFCCGKWRDRKSPCRELAKVLSKLERIEEGNKEDIDLEPWIKKAAAKEKENDKLREPYTVYSRLWFSTWHCYGSRGDEWTDRLMVQESQSPMLNLMNTKLREWGAKMTKL